VLRHAFEVEHLLFALPVAPQTTRSGSCGASASRVRITCARQVL